MSAAEVWLVVVGGVLILYVAFVVALVVLGRREHARAVAGFIPDCAVLFQRLLRDERVPFRQKLLVGALIPYLLLPFDLIPDFIPVVGQLDDAILVAFVLRRIVRRAGPQIIEQHWPGPRTSLDLELRVAGAA